MTENAFGIDISAYQYGEGKPVDFDRMKAQDPRPAHGPVRADPAWTQPAGVKFCAVRAGISWGYTDKWFARSWSELKRVGIYRMAYHVVRFEDDPIRQADSFLRIVGVQAEPAWTQDKLVLDLEVEGSNSRGKITACTLKVMERLKAVTGRYPLIYSRASWVNAFLSVGDLPEGVEWWLAQYYRAKAYPAFTEEYPAPPLLPKGVSTWRFHQNSEKGNGAAVGVGSYYVDTDRFNGDERALAEWFGEGETLRPCEEHGPVVALHLCAGHCPMVAKHSYASHGQVQLEAALTQAAWA